MNRRSIAVLNQLIQSDSYISVQKLANTFNVSRRTIYNDLDRINYFLNIYNLPEIKQVRTKGLYIDKRTREQITSKYLIPDTLYYEFSPEERKAWTYIYLVVHSDPYYLEDIQALLQVSRNTVLGDIKGLKDELSEFEIRIISGLQQGYKIEGNEADIRRLLIHYISLIIPENSWYGFVFNIETYSKLGGTQFLNPYSIFNTRSLQEFRQLLYNYEKQIGIELTDDVLKNLIICFYLFTERIRQGETVRVDNSEKEVIQLTDEYRGAQTLCDQLSEKMDIDIPIDERYYFAKYLLSSKVNYNFSLQLENQEMMLLGSVVEKMVRDFQIYAVIAFQNQEDMIQNLLLHLKPAYYRSKYGISIENVLSESVKKNYPEIFHLTRKVIHHFETLLAQPMHENEIAFIAMHFGGWLRKEGVIIERRRRKLLIVCTNGVGTSRLLESQLEGLFSDMEIVGVTSLREYKQFNLEIDFIVSTISLPDRGIPILVVKPVLNNEEKEQLLKKVNNLFQSSTNHETYSVDAAIDMIERYATIKEYKSLRKELQRYFNAPVSVEREFIKPDLKELLPANRIVFAGQASSWESAITLAAKPLLEQGYIESRYIEKMIQNINEKGPYVVISEQMALPHATPDDGVNEIGMSMLHLENPVDVLGKPVRVFIVLATKNNENHLKALSQLTKLFSNKLYKAEMIEAIDKDKMVEIIDLYSI